MTNIETFARVINSFLPFYFFSCSNQKKIKYIFSDKNLYSRNKYRKREKKTFIFQTILQKTSLLL